MSAADTAKWREATLAKQGGQCLLCCYPIAAGEAVADHCHKTGHCRGVLHRSCNSMIGAIENAAVRYGPRGAQLHSMLERVEGYLKANHMVNPLYHTFKTPEQKRLAVNAKARKARAAKKLAV